MKFGLPASIAGLPGNNACVRVGPPLSCKGPSNGSDGAVFIEDVFARRVSIQDYVGDLNDTVTNNAPLVPAELPLIVLFTISIALP